MVTIRTIPPIYDDWGMVYDCFNHMNQQWKDQYWLVVECIIEPPLWKICKSVRIVIPNLWQNEKLIKIDVPNQQNLVMLISSPAAWEDHPWMMNEVISHKNSRDLSPCSLRKYGNFWGVYHHVWTPGRKLLLLTCTDSSAATKPWQIAGDPTCF